MTAYEKIVEGNKLTITENIVGDKFATSNHLNYPETLLALREMGLLSKGINQLVMIPTGGNPTGETIYWKGNLYLVFENEILIEEPSVKISLLGKWDEQNARKNNFIFETECPEGYLLEEGGYDTSVYRIGDTTPNQAFETIVNDFIKDLSEYLDAKLGDRYRKVPSDAVFTNFGYRMTCSLGTFNSDQWNFLSSISLPKGVKYKETDYSLRFSTPYGVLNMTSHQLGQIAFDAALAALKVKFELTF